MDRLVLLIKSKKRYTGGERRRKEIDMCVGNVREDKREENIMKVCGIHLLRYHNETQNLLC